MSSFVLKLLAMIFMCCDHVGKSVFTGFYPLYYIGVCSFPLFAFQIVQGYLHTSNLKNFFKRLSIFAIISQIPFMLFLSTFTTNIYILNIFFTFILGLLGILILDKFSTNKFIKILCILGILTIAYLTNVDYGAWGISLILMFYIFRDRKLFLSISFIFLCILKYLKFFIFNFNVIYLFLCISTMFSLIFIFLYNNNQGKKLKSFFYMFYPIHLGILYLLSVII